MSSWSRSTPPTLVSALAVCFITHPIAFEKRQLTLVTAIGRRGYDPSYDWHESKGAMQVWMGSQGVNIGDMTGSDLYGTIWQALERMCPSSTKENLCGLGREASFNSICMVGRPPKPEDCKIKIKAMDFHWENEEIHKLLIGAAAGALEAATMEDDYGNLNCHTILGHGKGCNVGNAIRVSSDSSFRCPH